MKLKTNIHNVGERDSFLESLLAQRKVLHLGACDAPYTKEKANSNTWLHSKISAKSEVLGVDIDEDSVKLCHAMGFANIILKDIFDLTALDVSNYEYILFSETIEHITNPGIFLNRLSELMDINQKLIITTPNAHFWRNTVNGLLGFENNHPDHVLHFTPYTMGKILSECGFGRVEAKTAHLPRRSKSKLKDVIRLKIEDRYPMIAETLLYIAQK